MDNPSLNSDKYQLIKALRPFSYSVALITCGLGVALAYAHNQGNGLRAVLVMAAGLLLQAACNLANDYADIPLWKKQNTDTSRSAIQQIRRNFALAGLCTLLAMGIGLWLVSQVGSFLVWLGLFGILGGYSYTGEPVNYKQRGLGVLGVFVFTGVLMVCGAYYAVSGEWSSQVVWLSVPVSLLSASLLMANEIRDYFDDVHFDIRTLSVRLGYKPAKVFYAMLLLLGYPVSFYLFLQGGINNPLYILPSLILLWQPVRLVFSSVDPLLLARLPPLTGRFFMIFGVGFILSIL